MLKAAHVKRVLEAVKPLVCGCQAADSRVCWLIKHGETHRFSNPRCSCGCHQVQVPLFRKGYGDGQ